jgi:V/A-type H+/Na+-transporting ATPase subunit D
MALKFQYNKIALQQLTKGLKIRQAALPTLRAKEAALRQEVRRLQDLTDAARHQLAASRQRAEAVGEWWEEFDADLVRVEHIETASGKLAGVPFREFKALRFHPLPSTLLHHPHWTAQGIELLRHFIEDRIRLKMLEEQTAVFERERKRTTQKLNLFEKVQIPEHEDAIRRIKRYLEDEQNLAMAAMKMLKKKKENQGS